MIVILIAAIVAPVASEARKRVRTLHTSKQYHATPFRVRLGGEMDGRT